ncbi:CHAT domain-containing protein [Actinomadura luteofluorescens]|uniref:CHAT domain-containing protein n=1 Tax=Actinomadura luteofluorescens TaxID=46163 RepID=UPI0030CC29DA
MAAEGADGSVRVESRPPRVSSVRLLLRTAGGSRVPAPNAPARRDLSAVLLTPEIRELLECERRLSGRTLRLRLDIPADERHAGLRSVPWEWSVLEEWTGSGFDGAPVELARHSDVRLVREVAAPEPPASVRVLHGPVVLAAAYGVGGALDAWKFDPLTVAAYSDVAGVADELRRTVLKPLVVRPSQRRSGVSDADLRDALAGEAAAFYFTGHHGPGGLVVAGPGRDGDRCPVWFAAEDLADLLLESGAQVAVLMACHTAAVPDQDLPVEEHLAFAESLAAAGVPWVVSAQGEITSGASLRFAPAFFRSLAYGAAVDEAAREGCREMGDQAGLIVVHSSQSSADPVVRAPRRVPWGRAHFVAPRPAGGQPHHGRDPRRVVNPDVLWGLDRGPVRGILATGDGAFDLTARLDLVEEVVRQGLFDAGCRDLPRRGWFGIDGLDAPAAGIDALHALVRHREGWRAYRELDAEGAGLGFVVTWPSDDGDPETVIEHLTAVQALLPASAVIVQVSASAGEDVRRSLTLAGRLRHPVEVLAMAAPALDADARLDAVIESDRSLRDAVTAGYDPDSRALAALRRHDLLGWRETWALVESGASSPVKAVAAYLEDRGDASADLAFLCRSTPEVVAAAWRAGVRPVFAPAGLPAGVVLMSGCWALLARSRLTPEIVSWLYGHGPPLASITGLFPEPAPDHGFDAWLPQLRAAYRPASLGHWNNPPL